MPLSWNEIKTRAHAFSKEWQQESAEDAEAKSFWDNFFNVFGISRKRMASFAHALKEHMMLKGVSDKIKESGLEAQWACLMSLSD